MTKVSPRETMDAVTGITVLLAVCVGLLVVGAVALLATSRRAGDERAGYYGARARRARVTADAEAEVLRGMESRAALDDLAAMVVVLDRLAWHGIPVVGARRDRDEQWRVEFRDGTTITVRTEDISAMRRAAVLSHTDPLVVARVHPDGERARIVLFSPRHGSMLLSVRA